MADDPANSDTMSDIARIYTQMDKISVTMGQVHKMLNELDTDIKVIKETCKQRGQTCAIHIEQLDESLRGNGKKGVLVRLSNLEERDARKDKFSFLVIGCLGTGLVSLLIAVVVNLIKG